MTLQMHIAPRRDFSSSDLWEMHRLRAKVFKDRLGWDVPVFAGMEIDGYDALEPLYMLIRDLSPADGPGALRGCWRLLPTRGCYMLKDSFAQLLHGQQAPQDERIWELSRFAIETRGQQGGFGFSSITIASIGHIIGHGYRAGIEQYVTVTTIAIERLLRRSGVVTRRFGAPLQIGVEQAVALYIDIGATHAVMVDARLAS